MLIVTDRTAINVNAVRAFYVDEDREGYFLFMEMEGEDDVFAPWAFGPYMEEKDAMDAFASIVDAYEKGEKVFRCKQPVSDDSRQAPTSF